jgi:hypothetical protein
MNDGHADLEARFAVPAERDLPPGRHDLHREILMNHMLTQPPARKAALHGGRRPWRTRGRLLAAAAAAVAAGAVGYTITASNAPAAASHPAASHAQTGQAAQQAVLAVQVLDTAAAHVAGEGVASEPSPGQWIYTKTVSYGYPGIVGPSGVVTDQEWTTFDGIHSAYYANGQLTEHTSPAIPSLGPAVKPWIAWNTEPAPKTAYDVLASLPASPQALLKVIADHAVGQNAQGIADVAPRTEAQREFDYLTWILWNAHGGVGGPPAAEAAAYRAMATLPGITVQQGIKDLADGQAIGVSDDGGYNQFLIDPVTYQVIGLRQLSTGIDPLAHPTKAQRVKIARMQQHPSAYPPKGTLISETVRVQATEVPAPGDR